MRDHVVADKALGIGFLAKAAKLRVTNLTECCNANTGSIIQNAKSGFSQDNHSRKSTDSAGNGIKITFGGDKYNAGLALSGLLQRAKWEWTEYESVHEFREGGCLHI
jgi:hypothetical protein